MNQEYRIPSFLEKEATSPNAPELHRDDYLVFLRETQVGIENLRKRKIDSHYLSPVEARRNALLNPLRRMVGFDARVATQDISLDMLIEQESLLGGRFYEKALPLVDVRFFYYQDSSWIFHQTSKIDGASSTIRYHVFDSDVMKISDTDSLQYKALEPVEFSNFVASVDAYSQLVSSNLYR